jgi:hypothetical protein
VCDPSDENSDIDAYHHFAMKDKSVVTIVDIPATNSCRLIIRNVTGKYAWDMKPFFQDIREMEGVSSVGSANYLPQPVPELVPQTSAFLNGVSLRTLSSSHKSEVSMSREADALESLIKRFIN